LQCGFVRENFSLAMTILPEFKERRLQASERIGRFVDLGKGGVTKSDKKR